MANKYICGQCGQVIREGQSVRVVAPHQLEHLYICPEQADEAAVAFHGCCISAPHRGECVEPQVDATCPHSFKHTESDGTRYCSTCGDVIPPKPDVSLQLLVIDLGDSCVVKVERGSLGYSDATSIGPNTYGYTMTFAAAKSVIDAVGKPVPRIERTPAGSHLDYRLVLHDDNNLVCPERSIGMTHADLQGLTTFVRGRSLAGHPLPIYEGGTWELLTTETTFARLPMNVYRYTR